jgi:hypothetical protein
MKHIFLVFLDIAKVAYTAFVNNMLSDMFVTTALAACISDYFKPYLTLQCA